jgi:hypothetical protein
VYHCLESSTVTKIKIITSLKRKDHTFINSEEDNELEPMPPVDSPYSSSVVGNFVATVVRSMAKLGLVKNGDPVSPSQK